MRVAGDAMDLALLARAARARGARRDRVSMAMAAVAGVAALDILGSIALTRADQRMTRTASGAVADPHEHGPGYALTTEAAGDDGAVAASPSAGNAWASIVTTADAGAGNGAATDGAAADGAAG